MFDSAYMVTGATQAGKFKAMIRSQLQRSMAQAVSLENCMGGSDV